MAETPSEPDPAVNLPELDAASCWGACRLEDVCGPIGIDLMLLELETRGVLEGQES